MRLDKLHLLACVTGTMLMLSACGGGGSGIETASSTPAPTPRTPTPTPTPTPAASATPADYIIGAASGAEAFVSTGATLTLDSSYRPTLESTADADQLHIRYNASSQAYEVQLPASSDWTAIHLDPNETPNSRDFNSTGASTTYVQLQEFAQTGYRYSALIAWTNPAGGRYGALAFGLPTASGAVPTTGSAAYAGTISGRSTETSFDSLAGHQWPAIVEGSINLNFDFGAGTLGGSISPIIYNNSRAALSPLIFTSTVFASGSTNFSGSFGTNLSGTNSFSGHFTGTNGQEAIGNFAFPYTSLENGQVYQANGAWVAKAH